LRRCGYKDSRRGRALFLNFPLEGVYRAQKRGLGELVTPSGGGRGARLFVNLFWGVTGGNKNEVLRKGVMLFDNRGFEAHKIKLLGRIMGGFSIEGGCSFLSVCFSSLLI